VLIHRGIKPDNIVLVEDNTGYEDFQYKLVIIDLNTATEIREKNAIIS